MARKSKGYMVTATGKLVKIEKPSCLGCNSKNVKGKKVHIEKLSFYQFFCQDCGLQWTQGTSAWWDEYYEKAGFRFE